MLGYSGGGRAGLPDTPLSPLAIGLTSPKGAAEVQRAAGRIVRAAACRGVR